jgi:hypothetical protein
LAAYLKLRKKKSSLIAGPEGSTLNSLTRKRVLEIRDAVLKGKFQ